MYTITMGTTSGPEHLIVYSAIFNPSSYLL